MDALTLRQLDINTLDASEYTGSFSYTPVTSKTCAGLANHRTCLTARSYWEVQATSALPLRSPWLPC